MKLILALSTLSLLLAATVPAFAQDDQTVQGFRLEWLPRSFQKNPPVDVHVITEMTAAGRTHALPTAAQPVYYVARAGGQLALGLGASEDKPADVAKLEQMIAASLAVSHYLPVKEGQRPAIAIFYSWGSHSAPLGQNDAGVTEEGVVDTGESREAITQQLIERAKLIGGDKFAKELIKAMQEEATRRRAGVSFGMMSPLEKFRNRNAKTLAMLEDSTSSIYFVVASAYDAASIATDKRVLLWRTKMSTRASGVNLLESMPSLIVAAGPYFGKEMDESESIRRRINRNGTVELAPLEVLGFDEQPRTPATGGAAAPAESPGPAK